VINQKAQEIIGRILTFGVLAVTLFIEAWKSSEPVNAPKMLILSICGVSALFVLVSSWNRNLWNLHKLPIILILTFFFFCLISVLLSEDNSLVGIFGVKGRSTGLVTYFSIALIFLAAVLIQNKKTYDQIIRFLLIAGGVNIALNSMFILGYDPIPWSNPFGTILGTFGNPNFISSFLGIICSVLLAVVLNSQSRKMTRVLSLASLLLAIYQIIFSRSIQGIFVCAVGSAAVVFFYIRSKWRSKILQLAYLSIIGLIGVTSILAMLQKGPLAGLIYKTSVSLRGEYWAAGIQMGLSNPFTGVGLDSYGTWYRMYRRPSAMDLPGPSVVSDSAHNVFIDFFASGGFPLLFAYSSIQFLVIISIWRIARSMSSFSITPVALIAAWLGYTSQSIISINQIGLAVWGWVIGGAIVGYSHLTTRNSQESVKSGNAKKPVKTGRSEPAVSLAGIVGLFVGFLIAFPPVRADMEWRSAMRSANAAEVEKAMSMWPRNQRTLNAGIVLFANNGLPEKALEWSRVDVTENSESFVAWVTLFQLQGVSDSEKIKIYKKLHQLDPLNPEFQK
jgi:O-antigen ligase